MKTLVAGFGNLLLGDDGFGAEVVRRFPVGELPPDTELMEVGTGGFDLILRLMDRYDRLIFVDAVKRNNAAGTLYVFDPTCDRHRALASERIDPHFTEPSRAMEMARRLKVLPSTLMFVGCEPLDCDLRYGLSEAVEAAIPNAIREIQTLAGAHATQ